MAELTGAPRRQLWPWIACPALALASVALVSLEGRPWWCKCGELRFWIPASSGSHMSQHLFDPYSFTHVEHGLLFFLVLAWLAPRLSRGTRWTLAIAAEAAWEVLENAPFIIARYRQAAAEDYFGDSAVNVAGDIAACALGYALAEQLGRRGSLVLLVILEIALLAWIRDSLFLNMLMLVAPLEAIKHWQSAR